MARSSRQSKILELISTKEIETQDELARELKNANFDITQATISRDIKELGLTKILSSSGKYKYAILGSEQQVVSNKYINIFKECVISVKSALNLVIVKTIKGMGVSVCSFIDKLNLSKENYDNPSIANTREIGLLENIKEILEHVLIDVETGLPIDLINSQLKNAYLKTLSITGEDNDFDIAKEIFSRFCVGK